MENALFGGRAASDRLHFVVRFVAVRILESARRHGVADADVLHAINHALAIEDAGEDPDRWLVLGPDRSANLLEVVVLITSAGEQIAIDAMPMRDRYQELLER